MEMEIDDMHEPHLFNFAAFGIFTSKAEGSDHWRAGEAAFSQ